jgi:thiol-disulfide isomerase/thioredoxin
MKKLIFILFIGFTYTSTAFSQLAIGEFAPEIKLPDSLGKWKPMSEIKSKLILLDFWAAWCYPCILSMPDLKKVNEKWHDKGLIVYTVSLDKNYYEWVSKCRKFELPFVLVNDPYGFEGKACKDYKITSIPNKILIKDGKVIGANMSLYDLDKLIEKELNE